MKLAIFNLPNDCFKSIQQGMHFNQLFFFNHISERPESSVTIFPRACKASCKVSKLV